MTVLLVLKNLMKQLKETTKTNTTTLDVSTEMSIVTIAKNHTHVTLFNSFLSCQTTVRVKIFIFKLYHLSWTQSLSRWNLA